MLTLMHYLFLTLLLGFAVRLTHVHLSGRRAR
jgi:hypothetical protein